MAGIGQRLGVLGLIVALVGALWLPARVASACATGCPCAQAEDDRAGNAFERPPCCERADVQFEAQGPAVPASSVAMLGTSAWVQSLAWTAQTHEVAGRRTVAPAIGPPIWLTLQRLIR